MEGEIMELHGEPTACKCQPTQLRKLFPRKSPRAPGGFGLVTQSGESERRPDRRGRRAAAGRGTPDRHSPLALSCFLNLKP